MLQDKIAEISDQMAIDPRDTAGMTLHEWLELTVELQLEAFKRYPPAMQGDEAGDWFLMNLNAMHEEVAELGNELGWKPWTSSRGWVNRDQAISEAVDVMHFLANILTALQVTGAELTHAYLAKVERNEKRQHEGDDGRTRRCPNCGRSLDDVGKVQLFINGEYKDHCLMCAGVVDHDARR